MTSPDTRGETELAQFFKSIAALPTILEMLRTQQQQIAAIQKVVNASSDGARGNADGWLDAKAAARYLGISANTFDKYRYKTTPKIKGYPLDGKVLYKKADLDVFVKLYELKSSGCA